MLRSFRLFPLLVRTIMPIGLAALIWQLAPAVASAADTPLANLQEVPFTRVAIGDSFWAPRQAINRKVSVPHLLDMLEKAGNIQNLVLAAEGKHTGYNGPFFMDSDIYKSLEAACYTLALHPDPVLEARVDGVIAKIAAMQRPDGYLDSFFEVTNPNGEFTNLRDLHELYCAGHLFEAAVAHYQATHKRTLLNIAIKLANLLVSRFGEGAGKRMGYPGHPEIELALVKLAHATGDHRYFDLAKFFIDHRGSHYFATEHGTPDAQYDGTYWLDRVPIRELTDVEGHAVRAEYLMSGAADVARETNDTVLAAALARIWRNAIDKRIYVTGGAGSSGSNEGFSTDYDLPNATAYQETCASVAMAMWCHRMNLLFGDAKYADQMETALYNAMLAGVSLDGSRFFYVNPLSSEGSHHREGWFGCACCPPNASRTIAALGEYAYATSGAGIWVNLYVAGGAKVEVGNQDVGFTVASNYPWDGHVHLVLDSPPNSSMALHLRIPGWCQGASARLNGAPVTDLQDHLGYLVIDRTWKQGDTVDLDLPMPVRRIQANPQVRMDDGLLTIARGPIIYCLEACDQKAPLATIAIPADAKLSGEYDADLLGGVEVVKGMGVTTAETDWPGGLYRTLVSPTQTPITAVPYCTWDNRTACEMRVWMPTTPPLPLVASAERRAVVSISYRSGNAQPWGINDGSDPRSSGEQPAALCHWWPHKGGEEWVQYTWKQPITVSGSRVYWFDDTGRGECRLPESAKLLYLNGGDWKPVPVSRELPIVLDRWCDIQFTPVTTTALRLVLELKPGWSAGVRQWRVLQPDD